MSLQTSRHSWKSPLTSNTDALVQDHALAHAKLRRPPRPAFPTALRPTARKTHDFRTVIGACRLAPVPCVPVSFPASLSNQGPFPPQALPRFPGTTGLSATLPAQTGPRGFSVGACAPPTGLPVLHPLPCACMLSPVPRRRRPAVFVHAPLGGTGRWQPSP